MPWAATASGAPSTPTWPQNAHGLGPQVFTYVYATEKARHPIWPQGFRTLHAAADAWAAHMGLPPVTVTEI